MFSFRLAAIAVPLLLLGCASAAPEANQLVGAWKAVTYVIDGGDHPMEGLFIFTPRYYSANIRFQGDDGPLDPSNGNAGPYTADEKQIVFTQWVQIHVRPNDPEGMLSRKGPDEATDYYFEGDRLILRFPSGNRYVLERIRE